MGLQFCPDYAHNYATFNLGVSTFGRDHRGIKFTQSRDLGSDILGNCDTLVKAVTHSLMPRATNPTNKLMAQYRRLKELLCTFPQLADDDVTVIEDKYCEEEVWSKIIKIIVQSEWRSTHDPYKGLPAQLGLANASSPNACPHSLCVKCCGKMHRRIILGLTSHLNYAAVLIRCWHLSCNKILGTISDLEKHMEAFEIPFLVNPVSLMTPKRSRSKVEQAQALSGVRIITPSSVDAYTVLSYCTELIGVDLNECTHKIQIEPDHRVTIEEVSEWKPPPGANKEVVIELDFKDTETATELIKAFASGQEGDNTLAEYTLSDETELLAKVRAQPCRPNLRHVSRRLDGSASPTKPNTANSTTTPTETVALTGSQPPEITPTLGQTQPSSASNDNPQGKDEKEAVIGNSKGEGKEAPAAQPSKGLPPIPKKAASDTAAKPSRVELEETMENPYAGLERAMTARLQGDIPPRHPALEGTDRQHATIKFVSDRLVPTGQNWSDHKKNEYIHGRLTARTNALMPLKYLLEQLMDTEDKEDFLFFMLGPATLNYNDTVSFIQVAMRPGTASKHIDRLSAQDTKMGTFNIKIPVLDVHGNLRVNPKSEKAEAFKVEVTMPPLQWVMGEASKDGASKSKPKKQPFPTFGKPSILPPFFTLVYFLIIHLYSLVSYACYTLSRKLTSWYLSLTPFLFPPPSLKNGNAAKT